LHQAQGKWPEVISEAKEFNQTRLKTVYFEYARHLEREGPVEEAASAYEQAELAR
jgi:hypothetical protein